MVTKLKCTKVFYKGVYLIMKKVFFKKTWVSIIALVVLMTSLVGCSDIDTNSDLQGSIFDSNISMVKNGHPELIPDITYEEAYDNFFANPQWRGFDVDIRIASVDMKKK